MADEAKLKLSEGAAFVKSRLKRLPEGDGTWEAEIRPLPSTFMQNEMHRLEIVVAKEGGIPLADDRAFRLHIRPEIIRSDEEG